MNKLFGFLGLASVLLCAPAQAQTPAASVPPVRDLGSDTWVGTDALGRSTPTLAQARPVRRNRTVGIFYFVWHGFHGTPGPYDNSKALLANPAAPAYGDVSAFHWWGEPAIGYFRSDDSWVQRKNIAMLQEAGVDVLFFDVTNAFTYPKELQVVCDTLEQMRREGNPTPQIAFITHAGTGRTVTSLYNDFYAKNRYPDLWYRWEGKPLLLGSKGDKMDDGTPMNPKMVDFFTWRYSWAWDAGQDKWQWMDKYPQKPGWHTDPNVAEEMPVVVAGHPTDNLGRSYHGEQAWGVGAEPPTDKYLLAADRARGPYFAQQWSRALQVDPQFVLITGWNEWVAQRFLSGAGGGPNFLGHLAKPGETFFVDNYNEEYSRDVQPMKGGYADNYYMQMAAGIRQYKGVRPLPIAHGFKTIALRGPMAAWKAVGPEYRDAIGDTGHRDHDGWGTLHYTDTTGRNDITSAKVACDAKNITFFVHANAPLTPSTDPNWMQLVIDADQDPDTGWNGYDYVVNSRVLNAGTTTLKRLSDGKTWPIKYRAVGQDLMVIVPRALLGLTNAHKTTFDFHWIDNVPVGEGDIANWWYVGDSAPDGRFNYRYTNTR